jgi:UDPglucose 6-dehydrogenase
VKIAMVGTGYVGLVTGTCFADSGNEVTCVDIDEAKVAALKCGHIPIYEPGLAELVLRNAEADRLRFTTNLAGAVDGADVVYLAVGTPQASDGSADLSALRSVVEAIAPHLPRRAIVVVKSTVPVGTNAEINARLRTLAGRPCDVASNPEFLKEGAAIEDFVRPDRVVVGVRRPEVASVLRQLYAPFVAEDRPFLVMSPESAELTKYVANAMLATKISFINEMANVCEQAWGNIDDVRRGIGYDRRIGFSFLAPGAGYGGSCFPKDVRALAYTAGRLGVEPQILSAVDAVNNRQKDVLGTKIVEHFGGRLAGRTIALWGLAFKPQTDDIREAPSLVLIDRLLRLGARLQVHDPEAAANVRQLYGDRLVYADDPLRALDGADALAINTEWQVYRRADLQAVRRRMSEAVVFDGRNLYEPCEMEQLGFTYYSIGRRAVGLRAATTAGEVTRKAA